MCILIVYLFFLFRYDSVSHRVAVTEGAAVQVNFTLPFMPLKMWSSLKDFDSKMSLHKTYISADQLLPTLSDFMRNNIDLMKVL